MSTSSKRSIACVTHARGVAERSMARLILEAMRIGVISDTHGLLRPEVFEAFRGVDHILHGGDIGGEDVLVELRAIAPVTACAGNVDGFHCLAVPAAHPVVEARETARVSLGALRL